MSETVANPANSRPQTGIISPPAATSSTNATGDEELLPAPIGALDIPLDAGVVAGWIDQLARFERDVTDAERIDQIRALERLKSAAAAAQARISVDLDTSVRAAHAAAGVPVERQGRGVAGQIALARQESPLDITTPTGHTYRSTAPAPPGSPTAARRVPTSGPASPRPPAAGGRGARRASRAWSAPIRATAE